MWAVFIFLAVTLIGARLFGQALITAGGLIAICLIGSMLIAVASFIIHDFHLEQAGEIFGWSLVFIILFIVTRPYIKTLAAKDKDHESFAPDNSGSFTVSQDTRDLRNTSTVDLPPNSSCEINTTAGKTATVTNTGTSKITLDRKIVVTEPIRTSLNEANSEKEVVSQMFNEANKNPEIQAELKRLVTEHKNPREILDEYHAKKESNSIQPQLEISTETTQKS